MIKFFICNLSFLLLILVDLGKTQSKNSISNGLGIEIGGGHNTLYWTSPVSIKTPGGVPVDRTELYLTPNIRLNYIHNLYKNVHLLPFIGYNRFGGNKEDNKYSFDTIELGSFFIYNISNFGLSIGCKTNIHLKAEFKNPSMREDRSDWFTKWSGDIGLKGSYFIKQFYISIESWFGLTNLANGALSDATVRQNHYRILLGYTIFSN